MTRKSYTKLEKHRNKKPTGRPTLRFIYYPFEIRFCMDLSLHEGYWILFNEIKRPGVKKVVILPLLLG